jgi:hypothetical protein
MIHDKTELLKTLKTSFFQLSKKLAIVEYVWDIKLSWNPKLEQNPYLQKLENIARKYQLDYSRDINQFSNSQFDYEELFAEELESMRLFHQNAMSKSA